MAISGRGWGGKKKTPNSSCNNIPGNNKAHQRPSITLIRVLIDVSNVLHRQAKHGVSRPIETDGSDASPSSRLVDVNVNGPSDVFVLHVELGRSHDYVLPSGSKKHEISVFVRDDGSMRVGCLATKQKVAWCLLPLVWR